MGERGGAAIAASLWPRRLLIAGRRYARSHRHEEWDDEGHPDPHGQTHVELAASQLGTVVDRGQEHANDEAADEPPPEDAAGQRTAYATGA
jgi:hypothetical protein